MTRAVISLGLIALAALAIQSARAHHAFAGNYDPDLYGMIEGVVEEVAWSNPHVHYYVTVEKEGRTAELWDVETMNVARLRSLGWARNSIQVGDVIKVSGYLGLAGRRRIAADSFEMEDGSLLYPRPAPTSDE